MIGADKPNILVTGISGCLGLRLLPQLKDYSVTGIDLEPPQNSDSLNFVRLDLATEESCRELYLLMRSQRPVAVIHLAFVPRSMGSGADQLDRMWQVNVAGTARVLEAITEANRDEEIIKKFIVLSCASVYGTNLPEPATEEKKLTAHSLPVAIHKVESDNAIQQRAPSVRSCSVFLLRPATFAGRGASNHAITAFTGAPNLRSKFGVKLARKNKRLPFIFPWGKKYLQKNAQFVHVDDVVRVISFILRKTEPESRRLTVLNIAGARDPLSLQRCVEIANSKILRVPGEWSMRRLLSILWKLGISSIPPEAAPYLAGGSLIDTARLREFLGPYYEDLIQYSVEDAFADSFVSAAHASAPVVETEHTLSAGE